MTVNTPIITKIEIENLFNRLNYNIDFSNEENLSVLIAPNGSGKSTIFNVIDFLLSLQKWPVSSLYTTYQHFLEKNPNKDDKGIYGYHFTHKLVKILTVPFNTIKVYMSDGTTYILGKNHDCLPEKILDLANEDERLDEDLLDEAQSLYNIYFSMELDNKVKTLKFDEKHVEDGRDGYEAVRSICNTNGFAQINGKDMLEYYSNEDANLINIIDIAESTFTQAVNILMYHPGKETENHEYLYINTKRADYVDYQMFLADLFKEALLVNLKVHQYKGTEIDIFNLKHDNDAFFKYQELTEKIKKIQDVLYRINIIEANELMEIENIEKEEFERNADEYLEKLSTYGSYLLVEKETERLDKFFSFINERLRISETELFFKKVTVSNEERLFLCARSTYDRDNYYSVKNLSSGQIHDIVIFYNMLYEFNGKGIVLIDEPEISQHVISQDRFIDDIRKIDRDEDSQIIIATHSPHILADNYDCLAIKEVSKNEQ